MANISERIVASGHGYLNPSLFAVHSTANVGATALNHVNYWRNNPDYAVHLVSDWSEAYHTVPYDALCWQVGNGNGTCEGLEICEASNAADFNRGIELAAEVVAERLKAHGWGTDVVKSHKWFTENYGGSDHTDPYPYFQRWNYSWDSFIGLIANKMNSGNSASSNPAEEEIMQCIIQPNGENKLCFFDGQAIHYLHHMDEVTAINMTYRGCYGRDIPSFQLGSAGAPWASRLLQALNNPDPNFPSF